MNVLLNWGIGKSDHGAQVVLVYTFFVSILIIAMPLAQFRLQTSTILY